MDPVPVIAATAYEDGVFTLGFTDEDGSDVLLFSRADTFDAPDSIFGMDTYCISTEGGGDGLRWR